LGTAFHVAPQRVLPCWHAYGVSVQAVGRQDRIGGPARCTWKFSRGHRVHFSRDSRSTHNFGGEVVPGTVSGIGDVDDSTGPSVPELPERGSKVERERWTAALVVHDRNFRTACRQLQNSGRKALASVTKQP